MLIAGWQTRLQRWSKRTARRRHVTAPGRARAWRCQGVERLETRQLLSAAGFLVTHEFATPAGQPVFESAAIISRADRPAPSFEGPLDHFAPPAFTAAQPTFRAPAMSEWHGPSEFDAGSAPRLDEADLRSVEIVLIPPPIGRFVIPEKPLIEPVEPALIQSPLEGDGAASLTDSVKTVERAVNLSFGSPTPFGPGQVNLASDREILFVFPGWQFSDVGQIYSEDVSVDFHSRMVELPHELLADARASMSPVDGVRSSASGSVSVDPAGHGERQASVGLAALLGQNAETEAALVGGRRSIVGVSPGIPAAGDGSKLDGSSAMGATVGYLVAFDQIAVSSAAGSLAALSRSRLVEDGLVASLVEDLLTPHFACDAAALSFAINDLAEQVEELGAGFFDLLADPVTTGEAALVAGLVGAGLAYRHCRGGRRNERAEQEELLSSRFIRGHASLRLAGGGSA